MQVIADYCAYFMCFRSHLLQCAYFLRQQVVQKSFSDLKQISLYAILFSLLHSLSIYVVSVTTVLANMAKADETPPFVGNAHDMAEQTRRQVNYDNLSTITEGDNKRSLARIHLFEYRTPTPIITKLVQIRVFAWYVCTCRW
jgi:hypothetical protein